MYGTVVLADSEAVAKAQGLHCSDGLGAFTFKTVDDRG
jgi:hypothetical protein